MTKMFSFTNKTWNPLGGECLHNCTYGWCKILIKKYNMQKYTGKARLIASELTKVFKETDFVFVCDMCDLFGRWVPKEFIQAILDYIAKSPATFLLLTKNPARYNKFEIPLNCVCGATIESDCDHLVSLGAPKVRERVEAMYLLAHSRKMVAVEPILRFTQSFSSKVWTMKPEFVAVGYDNYGNGLDEPTLAETEEFIKELENSGVKVYRKTIREKCILGSENKTGAT